MESSERPFEEQLRSARTQAASELAELRKMEEHALTARMLVRKAILLQFEDTPDSTPQEIEAALQSALQRDDSYVEAYIELGRYYYAVMDDSQTAKGCFLKALGLLQGFCEDAIQGLLDCDAEIEPSRDRVEQRLVYERVLLGRKK